MSFPLLFKYSLAKTQKINPKLFFPLLLQGRTKSTLTLVLFVSHNAITGIPIFIASLIAFLSGQESTTKINLASVNVSKALFVNIPGGYLPAKTLIPVNSENILTISQPFSLLQTIKIS